MNRVISRLLVFLELSLLRCAYGVLVFHKNIFFSFVASLSSGFGQNASEHTTIIIAITANYIETVLNHIGNFYCIRKLIIIIKLIILLPYCNIATYK